MASPRSSERGEKSGPVPGFPPVEEHRRAIAHHLGRCVRCNWNPDTYDYDSAWFLVHLVDLFPPEMDGVLPYEERTPQRVLDAARVRAAEWDLEVARALAAESLDTGDLEDDDDEGGTRKRTRITPRGPTSGRPPTPIRAGLRKVSSGHRSTRACVWAPPSCR